MYSDVASSAPEGASGDATIEAWAREEFGGAMFTDVRHIRRLEAIASALIRRPAGSVSSAFANPRGAQAAYDFLENPRVDWQDMAAASHAACAQRCNRCEWVIVPVDGSSASFTDKTLDKGLGPIGTYKQGARGVKIMTAYALTPDGIPLGVLAQELWVRPDTPNPVDHAKRPLEEKESRYWTELQRRAEEELQWAARAQKGPGLWYQLDREADQWSVLARTYPPNVRFTVRMEHDRAVVTDVSEKLKIRGALDKVAFQGSFSVELSRHTKRKRRTAQVEIKYTHVTVRLREQYTHRLIADVPVTIVCVRERPESCPPGEEPVEWLLYTNHTVDTLEDALLVVRNYALRWRIERLHFTFKSGAGNLEQCQLQSFDALAKWITLHVAVASRLQHILYRARAEPDAPAESEFSANEIEAALLLREKEQGKKHDPRKPLTLHLLVFYVATMGGFMRSERFAPGIKIFQRGFERVELVALTIDALRENLHGAKSVANA